MFSHTHTGVTDFERAFAFYSVVLKELGLVLRFRKMTKWPTSIGQAGKHQMWHGLCFDWQTLDKPHTGNGQMVAFLATSRAQVRRVYETALANGGTCEGAPGLRPHYHSNYYGAYFRDTEGNKVCVACHEAE
jgi:lactoylglutathione lyase